MKPAELVKEETRVLPALAHLDTGLADVDGDDFTHGSRG